MYTILVSCSISSKQQKSLTGTANWWSGPLNRGDRLVRLCLQYSTHDNSLTFDNWPFYNGRPLNMGPIVPAKESPIKSTRSRKVVDLQPGNMTFRQRQNLFRNEQSNLYLDGELKQNKRKLWWISVCQKKYGSILNRKLAHPPKSAAISGPSFGSNKWDHEAR